MKASKAALLVSCDYCEKPAERIISSAARENRVIVCEEHAERGRNAQKPIARYPYVKIVDPPLPGRDRFASLEVEELVAAMRYSRRTAPPESGEGGK